jgi:hypothetical protein
MLMKDFTNNANQACESAGYCVAIRPLGFFRASEEVNEQDVERLAASIARSGVWTAPIPVERDSGIIMDGNHRARAARLLGLHSLPCVLLDYRDPRVTVTEWDSGRPFSLDAIYGAVLHGAGKLPYKTTRHCFALALPHSDIALDILRVRCLEPG